MQKLTTCDFSLSTEKLITPRSCFECIYIRIYMSSDFNGIYNDAPFFLQICCIVSYRTRVRCRRKKVKDENNEIR